MQTKVIVSGGYADIDNPENRQFFSEILKDTPDEQNILIILFAKEKAKWDEKFFGVVEQFDRVKESKALNYVMAEHDNLEAQIKHADIIYIRGGDTPMLAEAIAEHPDFKELIKGKIVAGESAGTYLLSTCYFSKTAGGVFKGFGIIPVKSICHFEGANAEKLDECPTDLEKLLLKDFEHKVYLV